MTRAERVYRWLLRLYSAAHREAFGELMVQHFRDQLRDAGTGVTRLKFWLRIMLDLIKTAPGSHHQGVFSPDGRKAIFYARYEATAFGHQEITLEHLLLGLVRADPRLRPRLGEVVGKIEGPSARRRKCVTVIGELPMNEQAKKALSEARRTGSPVSPQDLIDVVLQQEGTIAARVLRELKTDLMQ